MSLSDQQWCPTSVQVTVLQARGLRIKGKSGTNDAYAVMQVGKEKYQTSVVEKSVSPVWKEDATFDMGERSTLHVHVLHRALMGPDKLLGQTVINLLQLSQDTDRNKSQWFKLLDKNGKSDKDRGEVLVDIQFMRNNMTASMFDLSAAGKSRSRLGKFKDKVRGKKKESDAASTVVPSLTQVLTDSEEERNGDGEVAVGKGEKKKKLKMKSLFSSKSNLQRNMSQSMSVLPAKNSSLSGSQSSGLNVDSSEGKKKFKFMIHKRSGSSDSKDSTAGPQKHGSVEQSNMCINGSHIYCEEPQPRTARIGSNFSLASSGLGSMEDVPESSPPSVDSLRAVRQYSPWTEEEEEEEEEIEIENKREDMEEMKIKEEKEEMVRRQELERLAEEKRRLEEEERMQIEEEKHRREEEERIRMEEEERAEEEERFRREEEERERLAEEKRRREEEERKRIEEEKARKEEEERIRIEEERAQEEKRRQEEEERVRRQEERERLAEEKRRQEEEERKRIEEEEARKEEEERVRIEEERAQEEKRKQEEEDRVRRQEEERNRLAEEKRRREEEERKRVEEEKARKEEEEEERAQEEKRRQEEEERVRRQEEERERLAEEKRRQEEEERRQREEEEERIREEDERRKEEEEKARKEKEYERLVEENRKLEEEERKRIEEENIRREKEERIRIEEVRRKEEETERVRRQEEEQRRIEEEEKRQMEEEEKRRKEQDRMRKEEEERTSKEKEEYERLIEEKRKLDEEERFRREEQERIRMERQRRQEEEERARKEKEDYERLVEEKRKLDEEERKRIAEEDRLRKEEQERIRMEEERAEEERRRRQEEEERGRKEKEEMERLAEERRLEEQKKRRIEEEEKTRREERIRIQEKAEKEKKEEEARRLETEGFIREAEEQKKRGNQTKDGHRAAGKHSKVVVESRSPAEVTYINPFEENLSNNPFDESPNSPAGPDSSTAKVSSVQQRCQSPEPSVGSTAASTDEKDVNGTQREKRPAPQPPGRNQAERHSQREPDTSTKHLAQINKPSKEKYVKTASVLPQRSLQMNAPPSKSPTDTKNNQSLMQSSTTKGTTAAAAAAKHTKRPAPSRPRSVEEEPFPEPKTSHGSRSEAKQVPVVYGLNPFDEDEDENELTAQDDITASGNTASILWPPAVSQAHDKDDISKTKIKSSKIAPAPLPPAKTAATPSILNKQNTDGDRVTDDTDVTVPDNNATQACDPEPEAVHSVPVQESPRQEAQPVAAQRAGEEAGGKKEGPHATSRRLQPVKPLNPLEQPSVSAVQAEKDNKPTGILCEVQEKTKVNDSGVKGPYSQLTQKELISLVLKQETQLSERDSKISELERYIDNILVRVMEEKPSILMSMNSLKKPV